MRFINYLKDLLIVSMAIAFLWHFSNIARYGSLLIQEQNTAILISEIILLGIILGLGLYWMIKDLRSGRD